MKDNIILLIKTLITSVVFITLMAIVIDYFNTDVKSPNMHSRMVVREVVITSNGFYRYTVVNCREQYGYNAFKAGHADDPNNRIYIHLRNNNIKLGDTIAVSKLLKFK